MTENRSDLVPEDGENEMFTDGELFNFKIVQTDSELTAPLPDNLTTQQRLRDKHITALLSTYVGSYMDKNKDNKKIRKVIAYTCLGILVLFTIVLLSLIIKNFVVFNVTTYEPIVALLTICVTYITSIIGILKIITSYVFPKKDEEYITRIVELIQKNDLENKKIDKA